MPNIVQLNVTQQVAPAPSLLQKTGALISHGGTTLAAQTRALLTQLSDLTPLLAAPIALASLSQTAGLATATLESTTITAGTYNSTTGLVTLTLTASIGVAPGNLVLVSGATGTGTVSDIDGTYVAGAGSGGTTITYTIAPSLTLTITGGAIEATIGLANGTTFWTTIAGATPAAYNGPVLATVASATTFTFSIPAGTSSPATGSPTFTPDGTYELTQMATTFFAQGSAQAVYVLELGAGTATQNVAALTSYIAANIAAQVFYSYLVPREWDNNAAFLTLIASYEADTSKTYFYVTTTIVNYTNYTAVMKCVKLWVEAPGIPALEFTAAADFYNNLNLTPSSTNKVTPNAFDYVFGVTAYPTPGNSVLLTALKAAAVNYVGTGAEGGISNTIVLWGTTKDGNDFTFWYSIDWLQIQVDLSISNAVINGSNNPVNPLYYNQEGINRLQDVAFQTVSNGVTFGLILNGPARTALDGPVFNQNLDDGDYNGLTVINAVPFINYVTENPSDFAIGKYAGFTIANYTPNRGFILIVFNVNIAQFAT